MEQVVQMTPAEKVESALAIARQRLASAPSFPLLQSIVAQLEYLSQVLAGKADRSRLREIMVGRYAAYEFEETDPELAKALHHAQAIATKMAKGLKV